MKKRIFKKQDGTLVEDMPSKKYQGGVFVDDLSKPIKKLRDKIVGYEKVEITVPDESKPVIKDGVFVGYVPMQKEVNGDPIIEQEEYIVGYEKKELTFDDCKIPESLKGLPFTIEEVS